ncbi:DUF839 domain-containing protein [soil metagenome]
MSEINRRSFLGAGAAVVAGAAIAGPFEGFVAHAGRGRPGSEGYGPLMPVADRRDGVVRLELPAGFQYRSFHPTGTVLDDGAVLPGRHDGMAAFRGRRGRTVLVRNHEINGNTRVAGGDPPLGHPADGYDPIAKGGTVTVEVDGFGNVFADRVSLSGTQMNCAGGPTPWDSWLTCEETINGGDVGTDFTGTPNTGLRKHGYVFEVPAHGEASGEPLTAMGRFAHEAAVTGPGAREVYLTEDNFNFPSGFYRFLPDRRRGHGHDDDHDDDGDHGHGRRGPGRGRGRGPIANRGGLQMLAVRGLPNAELHLGQPDGVSYRVRWVDIDDPNPTFAPGTTNDEAISAVGNEGRSKGAALFSRLEGAVWAHGRVFFTSTQGGSASDATTSGFGAGRGQVWSYHPGPERLELVFESPGSATLDLPDNVEASRRGTLVLCEDGPGDNFLRGLTRRGELFTFARNADLAQVGQEFAGARFSPNGDTLFVNVQSSSGYSVAIWGPWHKGPF